MGWRPEPNQREVITEAAMGSVVGFVSILAFWAPRTVNILGSGVRHAKF
jgi:hypothetical protein